jgi:L-alanine-DL-glutamate epimerase-like enolase superfamily enzyme
VEAAGEPGGVRYRQLTAAKLQIDAVLPTLFLPESFDAVWPERKKELVRSYELVDEDFRIPSGTGLGITVDERAVERHPSDVMEPIGPEPPGVDAGTWPLT